VEQITYEGESFPYVQFDDNMPNLPDAEGFFCFVEKYKPEYIVNIGGSSLLIDTCSKLVPVLNINTVTSITRTEATVQALGRKVTEEDEELLKLLGKSKEDVIEGRFTFSLKPQQHNFTRQEFGIPEEKETFVMVVVGGRLTTEFTQELRDVLHKALQMGAVLLIIGKMDTYEKFCDRDEVFKKQSRYLGIQNEFLPILDHCDLYVNPKRAGGGTSVIEAMYKGCPAVSLNEGDVSIGAGEEFCVSTYAEMQDMIVKYMTDKEFYDTMSKKAKQRAEYMLDSDSAFVEIVQKFERKMVDCGE
jgi:glycosyltransferase involved in cell wall biosynthesis